MMKVRRVASAVLLVSAVFFTVLGDEAMKKLIDEGKFDEAVRRGEAIDAETRSAEVWFMMGRAHENLRNDAEAMDSYQRSFLMQRTTAAAEGIAGAAMRLGDHTRARDAAESAIALNAEALGPRIILANILFETKSYAAAAPYLEFTASKRGDDIEIWRKLAVCYENMNDTDKLAAADARIIALDPRDIPSRRRLAAHAMTKNDTRTALRVFGELTALTPNDPVPFRNLYEASIKDGHKTAALKYLKSYVELDSSDADIIRQLGDLLFETRDMDGALDQYRRAVRRNANVTGLYRNYAAILIERNLDDEALRAIQRGIALNEVNAAMYTAAGDIYRKRNNNAEAVRMYMAAMELDRQNAALLAKLAEAQAAAGDTRNAIVSYEQIVALNPNATAEFRILGDLVTKAGRAQEGMDNYKKYLAKVPGDQEIIARVGLFEYANGRYAEAIALLSKVTDENFITTDVLFALADSHNRTDNCGQAIVFFERVRAKNPPNAVLLNTLRPLAECYEKTGDRAKAAEVYNAFVALPNIRDAEASYLRAYLREDTDPAAAIRMYEANTRTFPRDHRNFARLGILRARDTVSVAVLRQAAAHLRTAAQLADTAAVIWKALGEVQGRLNNTNEELAAYTRYLSFRPDDAAVNKRVGTVQIERRQFGPGVITLEKAAATLPNDYDIIVMLGAGYMNTDRPREAAAQYRRARTLRPDDVSTRLSFIDALEKLGDTAAVRAERGSLAQLDIRIALSDGSDVESRRRLAAHTRAAGENTRAYALLNELAVLTPQDADVFKAMYEIAIAAGRKTEAAAHLRKYIAMRPADADGQKNLGLLLHEEKDFDGALAAFRQARRLNPAVRGIYGAFMDILIQRSLDNEVITVGNAAIAAGEIDARGYTAMGDIHRRQNRHADAARMYKGALDIDRQNIALLSRYAESQARAGDLRGAVVSYEQVILMNPNAVNEHKELGALRARLGNQEQAMASYKTYLEKNPADEEIALVVGNFEYGRKQFADAIKFFELVKKPELQNQQYLMRLADSYFQAENFKKAAETYERVRRLRNLPVAVLRNILRPLAISYERDNQPAKAAEAYAALVALPGVTDSEAFFKRAFLIEETNRELAIRHYIDNIRRFPRDARNHVRLGTIYSKNDATLAQAATSLTAATGIANNDADVWLLLAQVNGKLNRTAAELAAYRRYAQLKPQDMSITRRIGEIHHGNRQFTEAITNLEMFLATNNRDVKAIIMLADAYEGTNRRPRAAELLTQAKTLSPQDPEVRERLYLMYKSEGQADRALAEIKELVALTRDNKHRLMLFNDLLQAGNLAEAATVAEGVRRSEPMNFDGLMAVATIQGLQNKHAEAIETYKAVAFLNDSHVPALIGRANAHLALRDYDRAEEFYRRALAVNARTAAAELGLSRVYKARGRRDLQTTHLNRARQLEPNNAEVQEELRQLSGGAGQ
ncbi:MAG: tetratricopeptide repeat protein [Chitinispirillales bacterium]|jgi:tetratricopeptide (TPR) repeat protein|nr:tetratricopeptide repeat protein [Chitinispirillales bacterium]